MNFKEYLRYQDGQLFWVERNIEDFKTKKGHSIHIKRYANTLAGHVASNKYTQVRVCGKCYYAHRIIWVLHNGDIPSGAEIDHIDTNPLNNKIENLRLATSAENKHNMNKPTHNTSGYKGVSLYKATGKYSAYIKLCGVKKHLGYFDTPELASKRYESAANKYFKEFARV